LVPINAVGLVILRSQILLDSARAKWIGGGATGLKDKLISGWEVTNFLSQALMGFPADLAGNVIPLKDYRQPGGPFKGEPDSKRTKQGRARQD
jgi:hypothetical protein